MWVPTPRMSNLVISVYKGKNSVCKGGNVYGYKINIKVSGKIEGATSETAAHSTSIMIKIVLEIKNIL